MIELDQQDNQIDSLIETLQNDISNRQNMYI